MAGKLDINIPQKSVAYLLVCLTGVLIFVLVGIIPMQRSLAARDDSIKKLRFRIEEQRNLLPIYALMEKDLQKKEAGTLPYPKASSLPRKQIGTISPLFKGIARKANMEVVSIAPELSSLGTGTAYMTVNAQLKGGFSQLRQFFIGLGAVAFVESIEEIHITPVLNSLEIDMKIRIIVA
ncbi:MAG: hypothetical protein PHY31_04560 [Smithellaceae bacterium]|nr:hypothetical protein [Smithellaceae bacterium]